MRFNKEFAFLILSSISLAVSAQNAETSKMDDKPIMEVRPDVKTIYPDRMGLAPNTTLAEALQTLPELTLNGTNSLASEYTLSVDGATYNLSVEAYLSQTRISEIKKIELTTNGITGSLPGVMGQIKVTTKDVEKGLHANADLSLSTRGEVAPSLSASWLKGKWKLVGDLSTAWRNVRNETQAFNVGSLQRTTSDIRKHPVTEVGKWKAEYKDVQNTFKLNFTQMYSYTDEKTNKFVYNSLQDLARISHTHNDHVTEKQNINVGLSWEHEFNVNHKITFGAQYGYAYTPKENWEEIPYGVTDEVINRLNWGFICDWNHANTYAANVSYKGIFSSQVKLDAGLNYDYSVRKNDQHTEYVVKDPITEQELEQQEDTDVKSKSHNLQSFVQVVYDPDPFWHIILGGRGQYIKHSFKNYSSYTESIGDKDFSCWQGSAMVSFSPSQNHTIMAGYNRRMQMPTAQQLYPVYFLQDVATQKWYLRGNTDLKAPVFNIFNLGYSFQKNPWDAALDIRYFINSNIIGNKLIGMNIVGHGFYNYMVDNIKRQNVLTINASGSWHNDWLSIISGLNYRHSGLKNYPEEGESNTSTVWTDRITARVMANIDWGKGWTSAITEVYTTGVKTETSKTEGEWFSVLSLGKTWNNINVCLRWENFMQSDIWTYNLNNDSYSFVRNHKHLVRLSVSWKI